jgi:hypothetical protein
MKMFNQYDIDNIELNECEEDEYYRSLQRAINDGLWAMQGSYGRAMMDAIDSGYCLLGKKSFTDYYGNIIPSRFQVVSHSKGGIAYVKKAMGNDWYKMMEEL